MSEFPSVASVEIDPTRYMLERVDFKIALYQKLSRQQKNRYYAVSALAIILAAIVPVAVNVFDNTLIPTLLSLLVTILVGLEKLFLSINLLSRQADTSMNPPTFRSKRPPGRSG